MLEPRNDDKPSHVQWNLSQVAIAHVIPETVQTELRIEPAGLRSRSRGLGSRVVLPLKTSPTSVGFVSWNARALHHHLPRRRLLNARFLQDFHRYPDRV